MKAAMIALFGLIVVSGTAQAETVVKKRVIFEEEAIQQKERPEDTTGSIVRPSPRGALICQEISIQKHAVYRAAGLCFKDRRMIRKFGNAGCTVDDYEDLQFSPSQWRQLQDLKHRSLSLGCGGGG